MSKIASQLHSMLEYLITKATHTGKVGSMEYSIPYCELVDTLEDFEPLNLILKIETSWDDSEIVPRFEEEQETEDENGVSLNEKPANKNKKH